MTRLRSKWKTRFTAIGSLAAVACLCMPLSAQSDSQRERERQRDQKQQQQRQSQQQNRSDLQLGTKLMEAKIASEDGEDVGRVQNMAVDAKNGRIVYIIMNRRNSEKLIPVPFNALRFNSNFDTARLNINTSRLEDSPDFEPSNWGTINDTKWGRIVHQHYALEGEYDRMVGNKQLEIAPLKQVIGSKCIDRQSEQIGECKDLLVHPEQGAVPFVLLTLDANRGEDRLVAAPVQVCDYALNQRTLTIRANRNQLVNAPTFNRGSMQADARWAERVYAHFDVQPNEFYGYTPPTEDRDRDRDRNRNQKQGGGNRDDWQADSRYGQLYDESSIVTINGRVTGVERVTPMQGMQQGVQLNVQGSNNRTYRVHLGPAWFLERQQDQFSDGDQVQIVGCEVKLDEQSIIMANLVSENERVLLLRNRNGEPVWDAWREMSDLRDNPEYPRIGQSREGRIWDRNRDDD